MKFTLIENLSVTLTSEPIDINSLVISAMFGGAAPTNIQLYDSSKTYNKQSKILVKNETGAVSIYTCKRDGVTGEYNPADWILYNLFAGSGTGGGSGSLNDGALLSRFNNSIIDTVMNI